MSDIAIRDARDAHGVCVHAWEPDCCLCCGRRYPGAIGELQDRCEVQTVCSIVHGARDDYNFMHATGLVVVDEAYIDFAEQESFCKFTRAYPNLVVLQTLSKSFGLAGIRCAHIRRPRTPTAAV